MSASQSRTAMSMLEVMMALSVLTVALLSVFGAVGNTQKANEMSRTRALVMAEFEKAIEKIQASAAIYSTSSSTPYVTSSASSFDIDAGTTSGLGATTATTTNGSVTTSTPQVTVRTKTVTGAPTGLIPMTITVNWRQDNNNNSVTRDYYYAPHP